MEPSNVRKYDKEISDENKGVTEAEYTGSNAGPTDGGTNDSRNAPRASAPGVDNANSKFVFDIKIQHPGFARPPGPHY